MVAIKTRLNEAVHEVVREQRKVAKIKKETGRMRVNLKGVRRMGFSFFNNRSMEQRESSGNVR